MKQKGSLRICERRWHGSATEDREVKDEARSISVPFAKLRRGSRKKAFRSVGSHNCSDANVTVGCEPEAPSC